MKYIKTYEILQGASITNKLKKDLNAVTNQWNKLMFSVRWNDVIDFYKFLDSDEYNLEDTDKYGNTALLIAAMNDRLTMMKHLVKAGANIFHKNNEGDDFYDLTVKNFKFINKAKDWIEEEFPEFIASKKYNL